MTPGSFDHLWNHFEDCCRWLNEGAVVEGAQVSVVARHPDLLVLDVEFEPPPSTFLPGFPAERVHVSTTSSMEIVAVPEHSDRQWLHRYPRCWPSPGLPLVSLAGGLCMWYPGDPTHLQWTWNDGFDEYLRILQRHLWNEEYWRRFNEWPTEDVPHGESLSGKPHPILDPSL